MTANNEWTEEKKEKIRGNLLSDKWSNEDKEYLRQHFRDKKLKEIAKTLGRSEYSVYNMAQKLKLRVSRRWTEKEDNYLRDRAGSMELKLIAKQLFRTISAVRERCGKLGIKANPKDDLTVKELAVMVGITDTIIYHAIRSGKIELACVCDDPQKCVCNGRNIGGNKSYIIDEFKIRDYLVDKFPNKEFACLTCAEPVVGDIFCDIHRSPELKPRKEKLKNKTIIATSKEKFILEILSFIKEVRKEKGIKQSEVCRDLAYNATWYGILERGDKENITFDEIAKVCDYLGIKFKISLDVQ